MWSNCHSCDDRAIAIKSMAQHRNDRQTLAWNSPMVDLFCLKLANGGFVLPEIVRWWIRFAWNYQMVDLFCLELSDGGLFCLELSDGGFAWNYQGCIRPSLPEHFLLVRKCTCWICAVELKVFPELLHGLGGRQLTSTGIQVMSQRTVWTSCHGNAHIHHLSSMSCGVRQIAPNIRKHERQQQRPGT